MSMNSSYGTENMESLEKILLPNPEITKCTTGLTLHKISLDRCRSAFVIWKMAFNVLKYF